MCFLLCFQEQSLLQNLNQIECKSPCEELAVQEGLVVVCSVFFGLVYVWEGRELRKLKPQLPLESPLWTFLTGRSYKMP